MSDSSTPDLVATLEPVWRAYHLGQSAEALRCIIVHPSPQGLTPAQREQRETLMKLAARLIELEQEKNLLEAYHALAEYLQAKGLLPTATVASAEPVPVLSGHERKVVVSDVRGSVEIAEP